MELTSVQRTYLVELINHERNRLNRMLSDLRDADERGDEMPVPAYILDCWALIRSILVAIEPAAVASTKEI